MFVKLEGWIRLRTVFKATLTPSAEQGVGMGGRMAVLHTQFKKVNNIFCNLKKCKEFKIQGFGYK